MEGPNIKLMRYRCYPDWLHSEKKNPGGVTVAVTAIIMLERMSAIITPVAIIRSSGDHLEQYW